MLLVLHGHGEDAAQADALARQLDPDDVWHHVAPDGPLSLGQGGRSWFSDSPGTLLGAAQVVGAVIESLRAAGGTPLVVVAVSQGGASALAALAGRAQAPGVDGLACLSGFLAEATDLDYDLGRLASTCVLIQHGDHDDVVPPFFAADLATALAAAGVEVALQRFAMGHERTAQSLEAARRWLATFIP